MLRGAVKIDFLILTTSTFSLQPQMMRVSLLPNGQISAVRVSTDSIPGIVARLSAQETRRSEKVYAFDQNVFYLPNEGDNLLKVLCATAKYYQPSFQYCVENLKALKDVFGPEGEWTESLLSPHIDLAIQRDNAAALFGWSAVLRKAGYTRHLEMVDEQFAQIMKKLSVIEDFDRDIIDAAEVRLRTVAKRVQKGRRDDILTEMHMSVSIIREMARVLGVKYDVYKMLESRSQEEATVRVQLHRAVMTTLQAAGFLKVGLPGQTAVTPQTVTKAAIVKFLGGLKPAVKAQLVARLPEDLKTFEGRSGGLVAGLKAVEEFRGTSTGRPIRDLSAWLRESLLDKGEYDAAVLDEKRLETLRKEFRWTLDAWQTAFIETVREGQSVLAITPTSAGKTFIGMSSIEWFLERKRDVDTTVIAYIAPSFDLALQTYNNVKATFGRYQTSLVTARASDIVDKTQIWIGTPIELWVYFNTMGIHFDIGYFDEIHTISVSFGTGREANLRSEATANLLSLCRRQFIGLSATIHEDDIDGLCGFISAQSGLSLNPRTNVIIHQSRPVPQQKFRWVGDSYIPELPLPPSEDPIERPVTPEATFTFLRQMLDENKGPSLIFDANPEECWNNYEQYVEWLSASEAEAYSGWHRVGHETERDIANYNDMVDTHYAYVSLAAAEAAASRGRTTRSMRTDVTGARSVVASKSSTIEVPDASGFKVRRVAILRRIRANLVDTIKARMATRPKLTRKITKDQAVQLEAIGVVKAPGERFKAGKSVGVEVPDLLAVHQACVLAEAYRGEDPMNIDFVCQGVGPYFRMGAEIKEVNRIRAMFRPSMDPKGQQLREEMLALCEAERIREDEIRPLFELIVRGLEFGVGIVVPTIPFVVHYTMLQLLSAKAIPMIFASLDMSMGINYPIRTVCIRANTLTTMNVCEYLQAAGRSGRRRLDTIGYVVSWNIVNADSANQATLPHIQLPDLDARSGSQIGDHQKLAIEIEQGRIYAIDSATTQQTLDEAIRRLGYSKAKKETRRTLAVEDGEGDDVDMEDGGGRPGVETIHTTRVHVDDSALVSAVAGCVAPLAASMGIEASDLLEITDRIKNITLGLTSPEMHENAYHWARQIGLVKIALQELHIKMHMCSHFEWLRHIESVYELIHRAQLRQMRL